MLDNVTDYEQNQNQSKDTVGVMCAPTLLTSGPKNGTVHKKIGERHVFQCRALGYPTPRLAWTLPSGEIINETSNSLHMQLKQVSWRHANVK